MAGDSTGCTCGTTAPCIWHATFKPIVKPPKSPLGILDELLGEARKGKGDAINPTHYRGHPSGIDCIAITEHMNFCLGNAIKYIWRAGLKGEALEDLRKARWYIDREIKRLGGG